LFSGHLSRRGDQFVDHRVERLVDDESEHRRRIHELGPHRLADQQLRHFGGIYLDDVHLRFYVHHRLHVRPGHIRPFDLSRDDEPGHRGGHDIDIIDVRGLDHWGRSGL